MSLMVFFIEIAFCFSIGASQYVNIGGGPLIIFMIFFMGAIIEPQWMWFAYDESWDDDRFEFRYLKYLMFCVYVIIAATSLTSIILNFQKKSSVTNKSSTNYDLIILACPVAASGVYFGALMKHFISEKLLAALEVFLMIYLLCQTYQSENENQQVINSTELHPMNQNLLPNNPTRNVNRIELKKLLKQQKNSRSKFVFKYLTIVVLYTVLLFFINQKLQNSLIIVNTPDAITSDLNNETQEIILSNYDPKAQFQSYQINFQSKLQHYMNPMSNFDKNALGQGRVARNRSINHFTSCLFSTVPCLLLHLVISYFCSKSIAIQTVTKETEKQKYGYVFVRQSDKMSSKKMWSCMIAGFFSGVFVSLLGVGGSIVLVPALIKEGIDQQTATDSSTAVTFFSSIISILAAAFHSLIMRHTSMAFLYFIFSGLITILKYSIFNNTTDNNINKKFTKKIKRILYISSLIFVTFYCLMLTFIQDRAHD